MYNDIDLSLKLQTPKLSLHKPTGIKIANLPEEYYPNLEINIDDLDTLSFSLPYQITKNHELIRNPHIDLLKNRYLIKFILGDYIQWFVITSPVPTSDDDSDFLEVNCVSLENELNDKRIRNLTMSAVKLSEIMNGFSRDTTTIIDGIYTTTTVTTDGILKGTGWTLGNIPTSLDTTYRTFENITGTKLEFINNQISDKFKLLAQFDTTNRVINFYETDEFGINDGLRLTDKNYLRTITQSEDDEEFCTRLSVYGQDGLSIQRVNPINTPWIEDYSYFLYPFIRDELGNITSHSDYMTDNLCNAILDYKLALTQSALVHTDLLAQLSALQITLTTLSNEMKVLTDALKTIEDNIESEKSLGHSVTTLLADLAAQQLLINNKQQLEIDPINVQIADIDLQIDTIQTDLSESNYFTPELLEEKIRFEIEREWSNESYILDTDLYFAAIDEMNDRKIPQTLLEISIVNFLEVITEQRNHKKIVVGNKVAIIQEQLGIDVVASITKASFDFENKEIKLTISDIKKSKSARDKIADFLYRTDTYIEIIDSNKLKWNESLITATEYVDQQIEELNGSLLNLEIDLTRFGSDGFITSIEAKSLRLTLDKLIAESLDIINIATQLEFLDLPDINEKTNFQIALTTLQSYLIANWIGPTVPPLIYPIAIISDLSPEDERIKIRDLFQDVENKKSILINAIGKARQDDGKRYVESQIAELNTALSDFQIQVNTYINAKQITETQSDALELLKTAVQDESGDIIAIADGLLAIIGNDNILYNGLLNAKDDYYKIGTTPSGAIVTALNSVSDWLNQDSSDYPITIKPSKGVDINKKLKIAETKKDILTALITQVQIDNELTLVDQQLFEVSVAITSMQMDIKTFAKDNYITYDESISLKASFDKILAESIDVINIANSLTVSIELINNYQNSLTGTVASCGVDGLQVELNKWVGLPLISYPKKMKSNERKALLKKFDLVMSTKLALHNAINLLTAEYSIDGELSIRGTGGNQSNKSRIFKINKKSISASDDSGTGLLLTVISREDLSVITEHTLIYDTYTNDGDRDALATKLNSLDDTVIVALTSYNSIGWNQNLLNAMIRCGGTGTDTGTGRFPFAFVGIPKLFKGTALEVFYDTGKKAPYADINTKIVDGTPQGIAVGTTLISAEATLAVQVAKANRDIVMVDITKVASNTSVTSKEKKVVKSYWDIIISEKNTVEMQADYWNNTIYPDVSTLLTNYQTAYSNLSAYIIPILSNLTTSSTIVSATFINYFKLYFDNKIALLEELMVIARDYIGESISGLAESIIALGLKITSSFSTFTISVADSIILGTDLALVIEESRPLTDLATKVGLSDISPNEKTNYQTALNSLQAELNNWINLSVPKSITAPQIGVIQILYDSLQTTKTALIAKVSTLEIDNSKPNAIIATSLKLFADTLYNADNTNFQNQSADSKIECYFYGYAPLLTNLPSIEWDTSTIKSYHVGDLFYDVVEGNAYRFSSSYLWDLIDNVDVIKVLSDASKSQGSLDSELRIFVGTPQPPYNVQDLWRQQSNGDFKICIVERLTGSYVDSDWIYYTEYTDDIAANIAKALANKAKTDAILALEELADIANDNKIRKDEKVRILKPRWDSIVVEKTNLASSESQVLLYPSATMTTLYGAYVSAFDALDTYLSPILADLTTDSIIVRNDFNAIFQTYYSSKDILSQFIASSAKIYADTKASYFHIKYSNDGGTTFTANSGEDAGIYMGTYSDNIVADSTSVSAYTWVKAVGDQGIQGEPGEDGSPRYIWIKYATDINGSNLSDDPTNRTYIGVAYNKLVSSESTTPSDYTWSLIKGTDGTDGDDGTIIDEIYIPLYYPAHNSYVSTSEYDQDKVVRMGTNTVDNINELTSSNVLHTVSSYWVTGTLFALEANLSSSGIGDYASATLLRIASNGDVYNSAYVLTNNTSPTKVRSQWISLAAGDKLAVGFMANTSGYTCKLYRADLIIKPPT